jgi:hypothetical protein
MQAMAKQGIRMPISFHNFSFPYLGIPFILFTLVPISSVDQSTLQGLSCQFTILFWGPVGRCEAVRGYHRITVPPPLQLRHQPPDHLRAPAKLLHRHEFVRLVRLFAFLYKSMTYGDGVCTA